MNIVNQKLNESLILDIKDGRHPVIESQLAIGDQYIANDLMLDNNSQQIIMVTGPNMSGKSALLRQNGYNSVNGSNGMLCPCKNCQNWYG